MEKKKVLFLHGFASSARSTKAQFFGERFSTLPQVEFHAFDFNPTAKDFEYMTLTGLINRLRQYLLDHGQRHNRGNVSIIASSMGALVGLHYAHRFGRVEKMILLAPALFYQLGEVNEEQLQHWKEAGAGPVFHYAFEEEIPLRYDYHIDGLQYLEPVPPATPITIIHGRNDDVIPIDSSRDYAADFPDKVRLIEVNSDHRLNDQLALIWEHIQSFLLT